MKIVVPDYYKDFHCIADKCRHTCCKGWEIDIDEETFAKYAEYPDIIKMTDDTETPHFSLTGDDTCPFLNEKGLCRLIIKYGEGILCQTCRDHPRFRNFWTDTTEIGLGLVCEEAARLILSKKTPMKLVVLSDDGITEEVSEDESWLKNTRDELIKNAASEEGPYARLLEYLIYRHLPDALYDGLFDERINFIKRSYEEITGEWEKTDGSIEAISECARAWSYDVEYNEDELK